jgi:hypothetical protein
MDVNGAKYDKVALYKPYSSRFAVYYGEYSENDREGNGIYLYRYNSDAEDNDFYYSEGKWENDNPNGMQNTYYWHYSDGKLDRDEVNKINVTDGVYDGECTRINNLNGITYTGRYIYGIPQLLGTESQDGQTYKVYLYSSDRNHWYYFEEDSSFERKHTVYGFRKD